MLTTKDLSEIENLIDEKLDEKLKNLPTKDEFFEKMAEVMGELHNIREEKDILSERVSTHSDQLENHEIRLSQLETAKPLIAE